MKYSFLNKKFKYSFDKVYVYIVAVNLAVYMLVHFTDIRLGGFSLYHSLSLIPVLVNQLGFVWEFFTYMFVHENIMHLLFNMYAILMFGSILERAIGSREFLLFYILTGVLSGLIGYVVYLLTGMAFVSVMGASGAIYGLLFLTSVLFPETRVLLFFFIPMKMPVAILVFFLIEFISQLTGTAADIAHLVHLGGMAVAWLYCLVRFRISPLKVWKSSLRR